MLALLYPLLACAPAADDTGGGGELPPEEEAPISADTGFTIDTGLAGGGVTDEEPADTLSILQEGSWLMTPLGGPYTAMTGELQCLEILNGDTLEPSCALSWSLTGELLGEGGCAGCLFTFDVSFYLSDGVAEDCYDPELPQSGERWLLGYDEAAGALLREYEGTGVWIPWYSASLSGDTLSFSWSATVGITADEEAR